MICFWGYITIPTKTDAISSVILLIFNTCANPKQEIVALNYYWFFYLKLSHIILNQSIHNSLNFNWTRNENVTFVCASNFFLFLLNKHNCFTNRVHKMFRTNAFKGIPRKTKRAIFIILIHNNGVPKNYELVSNVPTKPKKKYKKTYILHKTQIL